MQGEGPWYAEQCDKIQLARCCQEFLSPAERCLLSSTPASSRLPRQTPRVMQCVREGQELEETHKSTWFLHHAPEMQLDSEQKELSKPGSRNFDKPGMNRVPGDMNGQPLVFPALLFSFLPLFSCLSKQFTYPLHSLLFSSLFLGAQHISDFLTRQQQSKRCYFCFVLITRIINSIMSWC